MSGAASPSLDELIREELGNASAPSGNPRGTHGTSLDDLIRDELGKAGVASFPVQPKEPSQREVVYPQDLPSQSDYTNPPRPPTQAELDAQEAMALRGPTYDEGPSAAAGPSLGIAQSGWKPTIGAASPTMPTPTRPARPVPFSPATLPQWAEQNTPQRTTGPLEEAAAGAGAGLTRIFRGAAGIVQGMGNAAGGSIPGAQVFAPQAAGLAQAGKGMQWLADLALYGYGEGKPPPDASPFAQKLHETSRWAGETAGSLAPTLGLGPWARAAGIADEAAVSALAASPFAMDAGGNTYIAAKDAGLPESHAVLAALTDAAVNEAFGMAYGKNPLPASGAVKGSMAQAVGRYLLDSGAKATYNGMVGSAQAIAGAGVQEATGMDPEAMSRLSGPQLGGAFVGGAAISLPFEAVHGVSGAADAFRNKRIADILRDRDYQRMAMEQINAASGRAPTPTQAPEESMLPGSPRWRAGQRGVSGPSVPGPSRAAPGAGTPASPTPGAGGPQSSATPTPDQTAPGTASSSAQDTSLPPQAQEAAARLRARQNKTAPTPPTQGESHADQEAPQAAEVLSKPSAPTISPTGAGEPAPSESPTQGAPNAQQHTQAGTDHGRGGPQPGVREESGNPPEGGQGLQPGGQRRAHAAGQASQEGRGQEGPAGLPPGPAAGAQGAGTQERGGAGAAPAAAGPHDRAPGAEHDQQHGGHALLTEPERIISAAVREKATGKVYQGRNHLEALANAYKAETGDTADPEDAILSDPFQQWMGARNTGKSFDNAVFITDRGRVVDRSEGLKLAKAAGQTGETPAGQATGKLRSEDLEAETVDKPAVKTNTGEVLTGLMHGLIEVPEGQSIAEEGFTTSQGRFVTRKEAAQIARGRGKGSPVGSEELKARLESHAKIPDLPAADEGTIEGARAILSHLGVTNNTLGSKFWEHKNTEDLAKAMAEGGKAIGTASTMEEAHRDAEHRTPQQRSALRDRVVAQLETQETEPDETKITLGHGGAMPRGGPRQERTAWLVIGGPGAGKSGLIREAQHDHGAVYISSDLVKRMLPEFGRLGAGGVHRESTMIADDFFNRQAATGNNLVIERTGKSLEDLEEYINVLREHGYKIKLTLVDLPRDEAARRVLSRFSSTGRYVHLQHAHNTIGNKPILVYNEALRKGLADEYEAYRTDRGAPEKFHSAGSLGGPGKVREQPPGPRGAGQERAGRRAGAAEEPGAPRGPPQGQPAAPERPAAQPAPAGPTPLKPSTSAPGSPSRESAREGPTATQARERLATLEQSQQALSRTRGGVSDTSTSPKHKLAKEGEALKAQTEKNARSVDDFIVDHVDKEPRGPGDVHSWLSAIEERTNADLTQQARLRTWEIDGSPPAAELPSRMQEFSKRVFERWGEINKNPVALAAWAERELGTRLRPYADGNGRISRAFSALILLKGGSNLPLYQDRDAYLAAAEKGLFAFQKHMREAIKAGREGTAPKGFAEELGKQGAALEAAKAKVDTSREHIAGVAYRDPRTGQVYTSKINHPSIYEEHDLPEPSNEDIRRGEGFVTNTGRFVGREEAADIARKARQTTSNAEQLHAGPGGLPESLGLSAEDLVPKKEQPRGVLDQGNPPGGVHAEGQAPPLSEISWSKRKLAGKDWWQGQHIKGREPSGAVAEGWSKEEVAKEIGRLIAQRPRTTDEGGGQANAPGALRQPQAPEAKGKEAAFLEDWRKATTPNPIAEREDVVGNKGAVQLYPDPDGGIHIATMRTFERGQGHGTQILQQITDLADQHGVRLTLAAEPFGKGGLNAKDLRGWYKRHRFVRQKGMSPEWLQRAPQALKEAAPPKTTALPESGKTEPGIEETMMRTGLERNSPAIERLGPGHGWPREGDPKPGNVVDGPGGRYLVAQSWRTADAKGPDNILNLTLEDAEGRRHNAVGRETRRFKVTQEPMIKAESTASLPEAVSKLAQHLVDGGKIEDINHGRKLVEEATGQKIKPGTPEAKAADEAIEQAVTEAARRVVAKNEERFLKGVERQLPDDVRRYNRIMSTYRELVDLYERQPNLSTRSSTSVREQAYSTPMPLAYLVDQLAGLDKGVSVYEPTAGNGALLIAADKREVFANELNPDRAKALKDAGYPTTIHDATEYVPSQKVDAIVANPPFGKLRDDAGKIKRWEVVLPGGGSYKTTQIDHAIAFKALEALQEGGRAVFILGGKKGTPEERAAKYNADQTRDFYFFLNRDYNVTDHFSVNGDLYSRQGAKYPVDVVVIEGRGKSALPLPSIKPPEVLDTWEALEKKLGQVASQQPARRVEPAGEHPAGPRAGEPEPDGAEPLGVRGRPGAAAPEPAGGRRGGRPAGSGEQPAAGARGERPPDELRPGPGPGGRAAEPEPQQAGPERVPGQAQAPRGEARPGGREAGLGNEPARAAEPHAPGARPVVEETDLQVPYTPGNSHDSLGTLLPRNQKDAVAGALEAVRKAHGELDEFVARELGYDPKEMRGRLSAEAVDAIALAVNNLREGRALVIGDQTGIGKGRMLAGVMRWAEQQGRIPVFVTERPNLFADIIRDTGDIGMEGYSILPTNSDLRGADALELPDGRTLRSVAKPPEAIHEALDSFRRGEGLVARGQKYNAIATTYAQMQTVKGQETARRAALRELLPDAIIVMDESHNAGGQKKEERFQDKNAAPDRAAFAREMVDKARGVVYASGTWAKRPEVMDLYRATDMRLAVKDVNTLGEAIKKGGVGLQQIVSQALAQTGQYIRRERSWKGVDISVDSAAADRPFIEGVSNIFAQIHEFDTLKTAAVEGMSEEVKGSGEKLEHDTSTGQAGVSSTNFASLMHNAVAQMLLAVKADRVADLAIEALKRGEKPVIALANTMESTVARQREADGAKLGDQAEVSFKNVLRKYLDRSREVLVKPPGAKKGDYYHERLGDERLGPTATAAWNKARAMIDALDDSSAPVSPIDWIKYRLSQAKVTDPRTGKERTLKVDEITGRREILRYAPGEQMNLDGSPPKPRAFYDVRPADQISPAGRIRTIRRYQNGDTDALIINLAGSTGISVHSDARAKDQRRRHMIVAQADPNIDVYMQILGRIHRTGQMVPPRYTLAMSDVPSEKRPAAVLAKKMASLNANVTSSRKGAMDFDVPDIVNVVGDQVIEDLLKSDREVSEKLYPDGVPEFEGKDEGTLASNATGRMALLPLSEQERLWDAITTQYKDRLAELDATGQNPLESKTLDLKAKSLESNELTPRREGRESWFTAPSYLERVATKPEQPSLTGAQVWDVLGEKAGMEPGSDPLKIRVRNRQLHDEMIETVRKQTLAHFTESTAGKSPEAAQRRREALEENWRTWRARVDELAPGTPVDIGPSWDKHEPGIVLSVEPSGTAKNPSALSSWRVRVAVPTEERTRTFVLSRLRTPDETRRGNDTGMLVQEHEGDLSPMFDTAAAQGTVERYIATGNILAAFEALKGNGRSVFFTREDGKIEPGMLLPRDFQLKEFEQGRELIFSKPENAAEFARAADSAAVETRDGALTVSYIKGEGVYHFAADKNKQRGGRYYLNQAATDAAGRDFVSSGGKMVMDVPDLRAEGVLKAYADQGVAFRVPDQKGRTEADYNLYNKIERPNAKPAELPPEMQALKDQGNLVIGTVGRGATSAPERGEGVPLAAAARAKLPTGLEARLETIAQGAISRFRSRQAPSGARPGMRGGHANLLADLVDLSVYAAAKASAAGISSGRKLTTAVRDAIKDLAPHMAAHEKKIRAIAKGLIEDAGPKGENWDRAVEDLRAGEAAKFKPAPVKATIRANAGPTPRPEPSVTEPAALKAGMRKAERAARVAYRQGIVDARASARQEALSLARDIEEARQRQAQMSRLERRAADAAEKKAQSVKAFRDAAVELVKDNLPPTVRGKLIPDIERSTTLGGLMHVVDRSRLELAKFDGKRTYKALKKAAGQLDTLEESRRYVASQALGAAKDALRQLRRMKVGEDATPISAKAQQGQGLIKSLLTPTQAEDAATVIREALGSVRAQLKDQKNEDVVRLWSDRQSAKELRSDMLGRITSKAPIDMGSDTAAAPTRGVIREALGNYSTFRNLMSGLDRDMGGKGPTARLYRAMATGRRRSLAASQAFRDQMEGIVRKNGFPDLASFLAKVSGTLGSQGQGTVDVALGDAKKLTLGQALYVYAMDPETKDRAHRGQVFTFRDDPDGPKFKINDADMTRIEKALPANLKRIVDEGKAAFDKAFFDRLSAVNKRTKGAYLEKVKGYWGVRRALKQSEHTGFPAVWSSLLTPVLENSGVMQARTGGNIPIVVGDFGREILRRSEASANIIHKAEVVRGVMQTLLHPETREQISRRFGQPTVDRLEQVLMEYAGREPQREDSFLRGIMGNLARSKTQLWIPTWLRNLSTVARLNAYMDPADIAKGYGGLLNPRSYHELMQLSPELRERWEGSQGMTSFMLPHAAAKGESGFLRAGGATLRQLAHAAKGLGLNRREFLRRLADTKTPWNEALDALRLGNLFDAAAATVAFEAYKAKGLTPRQAARRATEVFLKTANTNDLLNANQWQLDARRSTAKAAMLMFTSDTAKGQNMLIESAGRGKKALAKASLAIALGMGWSALVQYAWSHASGSDEDKARESAARRFFRELVSMAPGGNIAQNVLDPLIFKGREGDVLDMPLSQFLKSGGSAVGDLYKAFQAGAEGDSETRNARLESAGRKGLEFMMDLSGFGGSGYVEFLRRLAKNLED